LAEFAYAWNWITAECLVATIDTVLVDPFDETPLGAIADALATPEAAEPILPRTYAPAGSLIFIIPITGAACQVRAMLRYARCWISEDLI
jgi:hypothetical protein